MQGGGLPGRGLCGGAKLRALRRGLEAARQASVSAWTALPAVWLACSWTDSCAGSTSQLPLPPLLPALGTAELGVPAVRASATCANFLRQVVDFSTFISAAGVAAAAVAAPTCASQATAV